MYFDIIPMVRLFSFMSKQMKAGQQYMDSIKEKDIPVWIERTKKYLGEYEPNLYPIGVYSSETKPIPPELSALKILRIDISQDQVDYVWVGGFDHTELQVEKNKNGNFKFIAQYNNHFSKVIWQKENVNQPIQETIPKDSRDRDSHLLFGNK
jgi:hypothetical protein